MKGENEYTLILSATLAISFVAISNASKSGCDAGVTFNNSTSQPSQSTKYLAIVMGTLIHVEQV